MDLVSSGKHLLDYWHTLRRRRWVIYLSVGSVTLIALVGSFVVTPLYRATATVQIERHNPDILTFQDLAKVDHSWAAYSDFYQTQYKIVASRAVARKAVERLGLLGHPDFDAEPGSPGLLARLRALLPRRGTRVELEPEDVAAMRLQSRLEVSPVRNSQLLRLSWVAEDPVLAARVTNALAESFIAFNIESRYATSGQAEEFLVDQIAQLKGEISELEGLLQEYGEAKSIVTLDGASNITFQALQDIARRRTEAETALADTEAHLEAVRLAPAEALPEVMNSDLIARLRQEYAADEAEFSEQASRFRDDWPGLQTLGSRLEQSRRRLEAEIAQIVRQVRASAETAHRDALAEVRNLDRLLERHEQASQRLKRDAVEFVNLETEVAKKRETLDSLIRRQNEMALSTRLADPESIPTNIRITERARPPAGPYRPNTKLNLILGLLFGLGLGVGTAFLLDYLDNTINGASELDRLIPFPILAVIPRYADPAAAGLRGRRRGPVAAASFDLVTHTDSRSAVAETYRELRTSLLLSKSGHPPRRIMITSALPEEGKTATAINLGIVLAQLGRRVMLVDTDLRRPRLHEPFRLDHREGVSTYLSGLAQDPDPLTLTTAVDNLHLLPSGPIPPNPSELLNSARFAELGEQLLERGYDHVIFDAPPTLSVADPVIIASLVDQGILVVRAGRTPKQSVRLAVGKLLQAGADHFGVVLNDLDAAAQGASYYRYHSYGRYEKESKADEQARASGTGV